MREISFDMKSNLSELLDWMGKDNSLVVDEVVWSRIKLLVERIECAGRRFKDIYGVKPVELCHGRYYVQIKDIAKQFKLTDGGRIAIRDFKTKLGIENLEAYRAVKELWQLCDAQQRLYAFMQVNLGDVITWQTVPFGFNVTGMQSQIQLNGALKGSVVSPITTEALKTLFDKDVQVLDIRFAENLLITQQLADMGSKREIAVLECLDDFEGDFYKALASVLYEIKSPTQNQRNEAKKYWFDALWGSNIESFGKEFVSFIQDVGNRRDEIEIGKYIEFKVDTLFNREVMRKVIISRRPRIQTAAFLSVLGGSVLDIWSFLMDELKELGCQPMFFQHTELVVKCDKDLSDYSPKFKLR